MQLQKEIVLNIVRKLKKAYDQYKVYYVIRDWKKMNLLVDLQKTGIDRASKEGKIYILEMWEESGDLEQEYSSSSIDEAKNREVLDWWLESGKELKYTIEALFYASRKGEIGVLEWWEEQREKKRLKPKIEYKEHKQKYEEFLALENTNVQVIEWWRRNEKEIYDDIIIYYSPSVHEYELQEWILKNKIKLGHGWDYYISAQYNATFLGKDLRTLKFLKELREQGLSQESMDYNIDMERYQDGYQDILKEIVDWQIENNFQYEYLNKERFIIRTDGKDYYRILE